MYNARKLAFALMFAAFFFVPKGIVHAKQEYIRLDGSEEEQKQAAVHSEKKKLSASGLFQKAHTGVVTIVLKYKNEYIGHGSGFIVKENGYILTNCHVVDVSGFGDYADSITFEVVTSDGGHFTPRIIKRDCEIDLALLKINGSNFTPLSIGNVKETKVGDEIYIIGTPIRLEFSLSLTDGVVSGLNREHGRIQTSAILHGGNSGGPAFNSKGEVIGVSVAVAGGVDREEALVNGELVDMETIQRFYGVSYLVPINYAKNLLDLMY